MCFTSNANAIPFSRVHSEAEAISDPPSSPLALQSTRFTDKCLNQRTHLTAFMVPKEMLEESICGQIDLNQNLKKLKI